MKKFLGPLTTAAVSALFLVAIASASPPSGNAYGQLCNKGQWQTIVGTSGPFASQDACINYANKGGVLFPTTPTLTSTITGPLQSIGALAGNPQSRVAGGITDPAMQFTIGGTGWVTGQTVVVSYTADSPLGYTFDNPTLYFPTAPPLVAAGESGTIGSFFQDNCFDSNNVLVSGDVDYTLTASDSVGQSATATGTLHCGLIPATVTATGNSLAPEPGWVRLTASGAHFTPNAPITLTYSVLGTFDGLDQPINAFFTVSNADATGSFTWDSAQLVWPHGDNCFYDTGSGNALQTTDMTFTMTASDGTHTATATGVLKCSLLGP